MLLSQQGGDHPGQHVAGAPLAIPGFPVPQSQTFSSGAAVTVPGP